MKKRNLLFLSPCVALLNGCGKDASSISVIGGADGPTAVYVVSSGGSGIPFLVVAALLAAAAVGYFLWRRRH